MSEQTGYIIYTTRKEVYSDDKSLTGGLESNTKFLLDGVTPDPNYVSPELNTGTCPINPPPSKPINFLASNISNFSFTLSWDSTDLTDTGYKLYKDNVLYLDVGNVLTKYISGEIPGTGAIWQVSSYNAYGESEKTDPIAVNPLKLSAVDVSNLGYGDELTACSSGPSAGTINLFHTGSLLYPETNDDIYIDNIGSAPFDGNVDWWYDKNGDRSYEINSSGKVLDIVIC